MTPLAWHLHESAQRLVDAGRYPVAMHLGPIVARRLLTELRDFLDCDDLEPGAVARYGELDLYVWEDAPPTLARVSTERAWPGGDDVAA